MALAEPGNEGPIGRVDSAPVRPLLLLLLLPVLAACGGGDVDVPPAEETPALVEPPTPPPAPLDALLPQEPLPEGESTPAPTPEPVTGTPKPLTRPADAPAVTFDELVTAKAVVDRRPSGAGDSFRDGTEVFCFMRVKNPGPPRTLRHDWYFGDTRKSSITLNVKGPTWRTWSSRPIYGVGAWRVDVVDEEGTVLRSVPFTVR